MAMVTVSQKGWVVIPVALRNKYHWNTGDRVRFVDYGGVVSLVPVLGDPEEEGRGALSMPSSPRSACTGCPLRQNVESVTSRRWWGSPSRSSSRHATDGS